jgi:hypothetical protein
MATATVKSIPDYAISVSLAIYDHGLSPENIPTDYKLAFKEVKRNDKLNKFDTSTIIVPPVKPVAAELQLDVRPTIGILGRYEAS